ncbi:MAG: DUF1345 domain-containing protein [Candidatus Obscuribacter sp.]|nr:DUF1345 domain-containing protein [Candidatus Obscuribacter sp.]MBK7836332.1 DUF1345 domain-containing protein [Candidatus Obscuribacter sp.]MBK9205887.1 DUF1345 domain-containing protein [Candidatus Obscuribacter sp.]MBK9617829.1 DUF1345 domain-containing protein [Candidatus Obscuribacter sp.]MBK9773369.1 DUF1345 domain-containing protein [Candidatus Obscuribacter sp.]
MFQVKYMSHDANGDNAIDPHKRHAWGVPSKTEPRWPASLAIVAAMAIYMTLSRHFTLGPVWLLPLMEACILVPISIHAPHRKAGEGPVLRILAIIMIAIVNIANVGVLAILVYTLVWQNEIVNAPLLLYSAIGIWLTNVIVFSLWFWELDRGGPDQRTHKDHRAPDFLFAQMATPEAAPKGWTPKFVDYLYLSFTNATAFSPTDVLPLTGRAKMLMLCQSVIALITITLVAARAVNIIQ